MQNHWIRRAVSGLSIWLFAGVLTAEVYGQAAVEELPEVARERLEYAIGDWDVVGERLARDGSVGERIEGGMSATWLVPGRIVQMEDRDSQGGGRSWWVYDVPTQAWTLVSIGVENGAVWVLRGNLDAWVITSEPRERPNGGTAMIRFTHHDIRPNSFRALQEVSFDEGETWTPVFRQTLTRRR